MTADRLYTMQPLISLIVLSFSMPVPDQLANKDVLDDDFRDSFVNPPDSILGTNNMLEHSRSHSNTADHQASIPSHHAQPSAAPWTSGDSSSSTNHPNYDSWINTPTL